MCTLKLPCREQVMQVAEKNLSLCSATPLSDGKRLMLLNVAPVPSSTVVNCNIRRSP